MKLPEMTSVLIVARRRLSSFQKAAKLGRIAVNPSGRFRSLTIDVTTLVPRLTGIVGSHVTLPEA